MARAVAMSPFALEMAMFFGDPVVWAAEAAAKAAVPAWTAMRDLPIPATLIKSFGHPDCGVYAEVIAAGEIATGDRVTVSP